MLKDRKSAVLAAVDDSWRQFRNSLNNLVTEDMNQTGVHGDYTIADLIGHVTTWEWELVTALDRGQIEPVGDVANFNESARQSKHELTPRQILEEMEQTHRSLRDELSKAPSAFFEPDDPLRNMIDERSILHYDEHGRAIRIWSRGNHSDPS